MKKKLNLINDEFVIEDGVLKKYKGDKTEVMIPDGVIEIGEWAFFNCESLETITIPNSVTSIGKQAFGYCTGLTSVTIPDSVTSIDKFAFADCDGLTSIVLSKNIEYIGDGAFSIYHNRLADVYYNNTRQQRIKIQNGYIESDNSDNDYDDWDEPNTDNSELFDANWHYAKIAPIKTTDDFIVENGKLVKYVGTNTSVIIPEGIEEIGWGAFDDNRNITSLTIPNSVIIIANSIFDYYSSVKLTDVYYQGTKEQYNQVFVDLYENDSLYCATWHYIED